MEGREYLEYVHLHLPLCLAERLASSQPEMREYQDNFLKTSKLYNDRTGKIQEKVKAISGILNLDPGEERVLLNGCLRRPRAHYGNNEDGLQSDRESAEIRFRRLGVPDPYLSNAIESLGILYQWDSLTNEPKLLDLLEKEPGYQILRAMLNIQQSHQFGMKGGRGGLEERLVDWMVRRGPKANPEAIVPLLLQPSGAVWLDRFRRNEMDNHPNAFLEWMTNSPRISDQGHALCKAILFPGLPNTTVEHVWERVSQFFGVDDPSTFTPLLDRVIQTGNHEMLSWLMKGGEPPDAVYLTDWAMLYNLKDLQELTPAQRRHILCMGRPRNLRTHGEKTRSP